MAKIKSTYRKMMRERPEWTKEAEYYWDNEGRLKKKGGKRDFRFNNQTAI